MKYSYIKTLNTKAQEFVELYKSLKSHNLELDDYNQEYLSKYLEKVEYNTHLACRLIEGTGSPDSYERIIDLGGGVGFNSAFFAFVGYKNVYCVDIDQISTRDASTINQQLGVGNIEYVTSGYEIFETLDLSNTIICSRDVIEHIYDLKSFFKVTSKAKTNSHNTAAVHNSFFRKKEFNNVHYSAEFVGNKNKSIKSRDTRKSYYAMRQNFTLKRFPKMSKEEVNNIAKISRGLIEKDIETLVEQGTYPKHHFETINTNTCNPQTGNWAERVLSFKQYNLFGKESKLNTSYLLNGYNTFNAKGLKKLALISINSILSLAKWSRLCSSFTIRY